MVCGSILISKTNICVALQNGGVTHILEMGVWDNGFNYRTFVFDAYVHVNQHRVVYL